MAYVYKHLRKDTNEVFYIGIGNDESYKRANDITHRNKHWNGVYMKVGFDCEIIEDNLTWEEACEREKYWIKFYGRRDLNEGTLVNLTDGGDGTIGRIVSDETRRKMSKLLRSYYEKHPKVGYTPNEATRQKISQAKKGIPISAAQRAILIECNRNRVYSEETRRKMSESHKGIPCSEVTKQKISDVKRGKMSAENRMQISMRRKGVKASAETLEKLRKSHLGNTASDETKRKMSESQKRRRIVEAERRFLIDKNDNSK